MDKNSKIYIAGHAGLVGSALVRKLFSQGFKNLITRNHTDLDLVNERAVAEFFSVEKPEYVFLAAAKVGGIMANNTYRAQFMYDNLQIQSNIIHHSYLNNVKKLLFLGSSCIYPKNCPQPIKEEYLLTGELEYTNEPYAIAKIAGMKMCESYNLQYGTNYIMAMPTNLFGPNDNYDLERSHVLPALVRKLFLAKLFSEEKHEQIRQNLKVNTFAEAREILGRIGITRENLKIWGSGKPRREFLHSDDLAEACLFMMQKIDFNDLIKGQKNVQNTHINIGTGKDISIRELAEMIKEISGYQGDLIFDQDKPDGTMQKLLDVSKINSFGWSEKIKLREGIKGVYEKYQSLHGNLSPQD
jgi:GDP-L-fucose synthase